MQGMLAQYRPRYEGRCLEHSFARVSSRERAGEDGGREVAAEFGGPGRTVPGRLLLVDNEIVER